MIKEQTSEFYTGKGYLKKGERVFIPLHTKIINLLPSPSKCSTIVDLGCGVGFFARRLEERGYSKYIGIDFSPGMIKLARKHVAKYEYVLMNLYSRELTEFIKDYKCFTIIETLEHLSNDIDVLNKIPSGARIVGSVPSGKSLGHVRTFRGLEDVFNRYRSIIYFNFFNEININSKKINNIVTIFRGIKK